MNEPQLHLSPYYIISFLIFFALFQLFSQPQNPYYLSEYLIDLDLILCMKDPYFRYTQLENTCRQFK